VATDLTRTAAPAGASATAPCPVRRRTVAQTAVLAALAVAGVAALVAVAVAARRGAVAERIANPDVEGAPRPVESLWGRTDWLTLHQVGTIVMMVALVTLVVVMWRRHPRHPILLMVLATTLLVWQDPIMNWAPYAVYNPQLWHWPETWPLVSLSPTVEPFIVIGYATFYMAPFFPAIFILRRLQERRGPASFVSRHPLVTLAALVLAIGFVFDAALEIFLVRTQLYIYSQVVPFGSFAAGKWYQFPLIWESALITLVMIAAGVLLYRDDTGRTQAEKLAQRIGVLRSRPALGAFLVMFAVVNVAYVGYGAGFALIRATKAATSVACPYPWSEAKVYDPNGFYEEEGQPGPYFPGIWAGWPSAQAGRPDVDPPDDGGRCGDGGG
jgi:Spirocyclase AveC-like